MRKLLLAVLAAIFAVGLGFATSSSAAPTPSSAGYTCVVFQNPTVELVWSKVCHF